MPPWALFVWGGGVRGHGLPGGEYQWLVDLVCADLAGWSVCFRISEEIEVSASSATTSLDLCVARGADDRF